MTMAMMLPGAVQKLLPPKALMDVALALGLLTLGIVVAV
jgi:hypothetical protein